jgi:hypothetical protein
MGLLRGSILGWGDSEASILALFPRDLRYKWGKSEVTLALFLRFLRGSIPRYPY